MITWATKNAGYAQRLYHASLLPSRYVKVIAPIASTVIPAANVEISTFAA